MSIVNDAMILNIHIGMWSGQRFDRDATSRVTRDNHASHDAARVNKHLVPREALAKVTSAATAIRTHYYASTLPWRDNGDRLLTRKMYMQFMNDHAKLRDAFYTEVNHFLGVTYLSARAQAEFRMGDMFDARDYPSELFLAPKFYVTLDIDAVTEANDFRVTMEAAERETIKGMMEAAMGERINRAIGDVWARLHKVVENLHERLADKDAIFRDSLISNVREIAEMIPALNILDDQALAEVGERTLAMLNGVEPASLRKQPEMREEVADAAQDILNVMGGCMRAFSGLEK